MLVITTNCDRNLADFKAAHPSVFHSLDLVGLIKSSAVEFYIPACFGREHEGGKVKLQRETNGGRQKC